MTSTPAALAWLTVTALVGGGVATGASEGRTATDWLMIGMFVLITGAGLLIDLPAAVRRAAFAITVIVAANLAGRFDAPPAQYGSAVLVLIAWLVGTTYTLRRIQTPEKQ